MNAIIFGANGQDGYYLSKLLAAQNVNPVGVSRKGNGIIGDVSDTGFAESVIKKYQPHYIFHFAARSTTRHDALFENHQSISTGTLNILESARLYSPHSKIFLSGSAMQFRNEGQPINEHTAFEASSPYSVARIQSVYAGRYYSRAFGMKVYTGYFFNHDSPLRSEQHVNQKIAKGVLRIANGSGEKLELGNISVKKEFGYAGDAVKAVWKLVTQDNISEAVIGTGKAYAIEEWLAYCFKKVNRNWQDFVTLKQDFVPEYDTLVSDPQVIKNLGWQPEVDFYQLADMMMETP